VWAPGSGSPQLAFKTKSAAKKYARTLGKDDACNQYHIVVQKYNPHKKKP
jgi:hypothetical protein